MKNSVKYILLFGLIAAAGVFAIVGIPALLGGNSTGGERTVEGEVLNIDDILSNDKGTRYIVQFKLYSGETWTLSINQYNPPTPITVGMRIHATGTLEQFTTDYLNVAAGDWYQIV